jgi:hypothetical protein
VVTKWLRIIKLVIIVEYWEERKKICDSCEYNGEWFCKKCGCILPVKVRIKGSECPLNKWKSIK